VQYNPTVMLVGVVFYIIIGLAPLAALALGAGPLRWLGAAAVGWQLLVHALVAREAHLPLRAVLLYPVIYLIFAWIVLRAMVLNLRQGGIYWRDTFYPLSELRKNRV